MQQFERYLDCSTQIQIKPVFKRSTSLQRYTLHLLNADDEKFNVARWMRRTKWLIYVGVFLDLLIWRTCKDKSVKIGFVTPFFSETNRNSTKTLTTRINKFEWCVYSRNWLIMEMSVAKGNKKDKVNFIFIINCIIFYQLCSSFHKWHFSITYK